MGVVGWGGLRYMSFPACRPFDLAVKYQVGWSRGELKGTEESCFTQLSIVLTPPPG